MTNLARFTINGSASTNRGVDVLNAASATFQLETPTSEVWKVTFSVSDATDVNAPLASLDAPELELDNGAGSTGTSVDAAPVSGTVTTTWPATGVHSYIVRCKVNNGVDPDGAVNEDYVFERMCSIRTVEGARKIVATEGTQYSSRGWADAQNEIVDAFIAAGGWITAGALNQILQNDGSGWEPANEITLPGGSDRTIKIADVDSASGADILVIEGNTNSNASGIAGGVSIRLGSATAAEDAATFDIRDSDGYTCFACGGGAVGDDDPVIGFYGETPIARQTLTSYDLNDLTDALVNLGLIDLVLS